MSKYRPPEGTLMLPSNGSAGQSNGAVLQSVLVARMDIHRNAKYVSSALYVGALVGAQIVTNWPKRLTLCSLPRRAVSVVAQPTVA